MLKNVKNLILHDLKYIIYKRKVIYLFLLVSIYMIFNFSFKVSGSSLNLWDLYGAVFMSSSMTLYIPCIMSIYFSATIFFDSELNTFIKIRILSKRQWYVSKVITIFILNLFTILIFSLISLIIGGIFFGLSNTWSDSSIIAANETSMNVLNFKYVNFYSPVKLLFINSIIYSTFMCFIVIISSLIGILFNKPNIGLLMPIFYIFISLILRIMNGSKILKYIIYQNYMLFGQRNYYNSDMIVNLYLTMKEAFFIPIILFIITIILGLIIIKKVDFIIGEKHLWI